MSTSLHLTAEEFDRMVERGSFAHLHRKIELIGGELREMNPAGPVHDDLIQYLLNWSGRSVPDGVSVTSQTGLDLRELASRPEPDLMWIKTKRYRGRHPGPEDVLLAIEVADSSLEHDQTVKAALYAQAGIPEYWIIDANTESAHVFREPRDGSYESRQILLLGQSMAPLAAPGTELTLQALFRG